VGLGGNEIMVTDKVEWRYVWITENGLVVEGGLGWRGFWKSEIGEVRLNRELLMWEGVVYLGGKKYRIREYYESGEAAEKAVERAYERERGKIPT